MALPLAIPTNSLIADAQAARLRKQQELLTPAESQVPVNQSVLDTPSVQESPRMNFSGSNNAQLFSSGLSGAINALTQTGRDERAQLQTDKQAEQSRIKQGRADLQYNQGLVEAELARSKTAQQYGQQQLDLRTGVEGANATHNAQVQGQQIDAQAQGIKEALLDNPDKPDFKNFTKHDLGRADKINQYYTETAELGQSGVVQRGLSLQTKDVREDTGAVENYTESVTEAKAALLKGKNFKGLTPAILDYALYSVLQESQTSGGTVFDWFKGDLNTGDLIKATKEVIPDMIRLGSLAHEIDIVNTQATSQKQHVNNLAAEANLKKLYQGN